MLSCPMVSSSVGSNVNNTPIPPYKLVNKVTANIIPASLGNPIAAKGGESSSLNQPATPASSRTRERNIIGNIIFNKKVVVTRDLFITPTINHYHLIP